MCTEDIKNEDIVEIENLLEKLSTESQIETDASCGGCGICGPCYLTPAAPGVPW